MPSPTIRRALVSVSDKTGIVEFCQQLRRLHIDIISTGGTANLLREHKIPVTDVSTYTGFPEIMGGRVKTLHPKIHGALLGRIKQDSEVMTKHGIIPIDLVVSNLYPFTQTIAQADTTLETAIEQIDIGGPTMLRAAAKNHQRVGVICDCSDYPAVIKELVENDGKLGHDTRFQLASKAFSHTAAYDMAIANYLSQINSDTPESPLPATYQVTYQKKQDLRYGENPHQQAAFYQANTPQERGSISNAKVRQGKPLSFNNIADADAAIECVRHFQQSACVIVKHANPCGAAVSTDALSAYQQAYQTDSTSAFGGIIAFNCPLDVSTAKAILEQQFVEVIIAPEVAPNALSLFHEKPTIRILETGPLTPTLQPDWDYKKVNGGLLVQQRDDQLYQGELTVVTQTQPTANQLSDLRFAWIVAKYVKSNAIVFASDERTIGIGAGQMSRIDSTNIARIKAQAAKLDITDAVMASDAFFPFRDAIDQAAAAGIKAIIQPGGSKRDPEVIAAADEAGIAMVFSHTRHFRH